MGKTVDGADIATVCGQDIPDIVAVTCLQDITAGTAVHCAADTAAIDDKLILLAVAGEIIEAGKSNAIDVTTVNTANGPGVGDVISR